MAKTDQHVRAKTHDGTSAIDGVLEKETDDFLYVVPRGSKKAVPLDKDTWTAAPVLPHAPGTVIQTAGSVQVRVGERWLRVSDGMEIIQQPDVEHTVLYAPEHDDNAT